MERARSFGTVAELYDAARPELPEESVRWLGVRPGSRVVDVAAGTGLSSRPLARVGAEVIAVEPDARMGEVIRRRAPEVTWCLGTAEHLPVDDAWADLVVVVSAWHWLDSQLATAEAARVLRDGGTFAIIWNGPNIESPDVREIFELRRASGTATDTVAAPARVRHASALESLLLGGTTSFGDADSVSLDWTWPRTVEQVVSLLDTYSGVITAHAAERTALLDEARRRALAARDSDGLVHVPMSTRCWRARRRAR
jgi:SAM-dependent methyltransferase